MKLIDEVSYCLTDPRMPDHLTEIPEIMKWAILLVEIREEQQYGGDHILLEMYRIKASFGSFSLYVLAQDRVDFSVYHLCMAGLVMQKEGKRPQNCPIPGTRAHAGLVSLCNRFSGRLHGHEY